MHKSMLNYEFTMYMFLYVYYVVDAIYVDNAILIRANTMYDLYRKALNSEVITR